MIVPKMTLEEIYPEIQSDSQNVPEFKIEQFQKDFRKHVLKSTKFPVTKLYTYQSGNCNTITVILTADKRGKHSSPSIGFHCVYARKEGKYLAIWSLLQKRMTVFSPHSLLRYKERIIKDMALTPDEVIKHFITNTKGLVSLEINDDVEAVFKCFEGHYSNEKVDIVAATNEAYCFGEIYGNAKIIKTIISEEDLFENQKKLFPSLRNTLEQYTDYIHSL